MTWIWLAAALVGCVAAASSVMRVARGQTRLSAGLWWAGIGVGYLVALLHATWPAF